KFGLSTERLFLQESTSFRRRTARLSKYETGARYGQSWLPKRASRRSQFPCNTTTHPRADPGWNSQTNRRMISGKGRQGGTSHGRGEKEMCAPRVQLPGGARQEILQRLLPRCGRHHGDRVQLPSRRE